MTTSVHLIEGDMLERLPELEANSFDSCVSDAPYELGFMGKSWDSTGIAFQPQAWAAVLRVLKPGAHLLAFGGTRGFHRMACAIEDAGFQIRDTLAWVYGTGFPKSKHALKPAYEPIILARTPLIGTVAVNVLEYGTGSLNIDACRIGSEERAAFEYFDTGCKSGYSGGIKGGRQIGLKTEGRWPANLIVDGSGEVAECFPNGAARFFYSAKASKQDRGEGNSHPTVKPTDLMRYLCRLITPVGGSILDPFMGSGSTGKAAVLEGFGFTGIELDPAYLDIAERRIVACC